MEYAVAICFNAAALWTAPERPTESAIYSVSLFTWRMKDYWSVGFLSLGKHTFRWIDAHKFVTSILSTQRVDIYILVKFHRYLCQGIYKLEKQHKEASKILISKSGRWACYNCRNYGSLVARASIHMRFHWGPWSCLSQPVNFLWAFGA